MSVLRNVFVDPIPEADAFALMYAKASYHDVHYIDCQTAQYGTFAKLLRDYLAAGADVLEYGRGLGLFVQALHSVDFKASGVEYGEDAAAYAAEVTGCPVVSVADFIATRREATHEALDVGDVLEHLPDPGAALGDLLRFVKSGGLLFAEGPLENNPSPVYGQRVYSAG
jgi:2-polyprenyl-3-methyl-5-hydroxy-6-metoxy-1,4-benzoquinol methylase